VHRVRGFVSAASLVAAGIGVAVVPTLLQCLQLPGVVYLPFAGVAKAARAFIEQVRKSAPPAASRTTT
jgi:hypothetical protein